jgi:hypothetical protein
MPDLLLQDFEASLLPSELGDSNQNAFLILFELLPGLAYAHQPLTVGESQSPSLLAKAIPLFLQ